MIKTSSMNTHVFKMIDYIKKLSQLGLVMGGELSQYFCTSAFQLQ
jgi:hypothetical protein